VHILQAPPTSLWQLQVHEHERGCCHTSIQEEAPRHGEPVGERDESHGHQCTRQPVHCRAKAGALRAQPQRNDLRAVRRRQRPEPNRERGHEGQHRRDARRSAYRGRAADAERQGHRGQRRRRAGGAGEEEGAPADAVGQERRHEDEACLHHSHGDGCPEDGAVRRHAGLLEHQRAVQHDGVDAGGLLEEQHADRADEDPAHRFRRPPQHLLPHANAAAAAAVSRCPRRLDGFLDLLESEVGLSWGGAQEHGARLPVAPAHHQPPRRLWHGKYPRGQEHRWQRADGEHDAPAGVHWQAGERVVRHVAKQDADVDKHLQDPAHTDVHRRQIKAAEKEGRNGTRRNHTTMPAHVYIHIRTSSKDDRTPRVDAGEISALYTGATTRANPTPTLVTKRAATSAA
jgi:hypothetical protein